MPFRLLRPLAARPLSTQIALLCGAIAIAVAASVGTGAALISRTQAIRIVQDDISAVAAVMADRIGRGVEARIRDLSLIASLEPSRGHWIADPQSVRDVLELAKQGTRIYAWLGFADAQGRVIAATDRLMEGVSVADSPWFQNGQKDGYVGDVYRAPHLRAKPGARWPEVFDVSMPIRSSTGEIVGVLGANVHWAWMAEIRDAFLMADREADGEIIVLRRDGTAIMGAPYGVGILSAEMAEEAYRRGRGVVEDDVHLAAYSVMRGRAGAHLGWIVLTRQPKAVALAEVSYMTRVIVLIGLVTAVLGFVAAYPLAMHLSRPLRALAAEADEIGSGPFQGLTALYRGSEEISTLSVSLRALLQRLGVEERLHRATLEHTSRLVADLRSMRDLAETDPLTGLRNRRSFDAVVSYEAFTVVAVVDIDNFKDVNDTFGHAVGDDVLKNVAGVLSNCLRDSDISARYGGEEFVVVMRNVGLEGGLRLSERLLEAISASIFLPDGQNITASIGVAEWRAGLSFDEVFANADDALYRAKHNGRNRVCAIRESLAS